MLARLQKFEGGEALGEIAAVDPVGECLRVVLSEREHLDAFEAALAALLPSSEDGDEVMKALYAGE